MRKAAEGAKASCVSAFCARGRTTVRRMGAALGHSHPAAKRKVNRGEEDQATKEKEKEKNRRRLSTGK